MTDDDGETLGRRAAWLRARKQAARLDLVPRCRHGREAGSGALFRPGQAVDLGIAVGPAAKTARLNNITTRCQTRIAAAARHLGVIQADPTVARSMSVSHKNIGFDERRPAQPRIDPCFRAPPTDLSQPGRGRPLPGCGRWGPAR